ncbi:MAG: peptidoglycan-binding protein, partial [Acidimicrobiia bacterium]
MRRVRGERGRTGAVVVAVLAGIATVGAVSVGVAFVAAPSDDEPRGAGPTVPADPTSTSGAPATTGTTGAPTSTTSVLATTTSTVPPTTTTTAPPATEPPAPVAPVTLRPGDTGPEVAALQQRLLDLGYWLAAADGEYGSTTQQAVMAFQKVSDLGRDGVAGPVTRAALDTATRPTPRTASGDHIEIDLARQVLL